MRKFSGLKRSTFKIFETIYFKISFMRLRFCMLLVLILGILNTKNNNFTLKTEKDDALSGEHRGTIK